jgi:hypothetical protein
MEDLERLAAFERLQLEVEVAEREREHAWARVRLYEVAIGRRLAHPLVRQHVLARLAAEPVVDASGRLDSLPDLGSSVANVVQRHFARELLVRTVAQSTAVEMNRVIRRLRVRPVVVASRPIIRRREQGRRPIARRCSRRARSPGRRSGDDPDPPRRRGFLRKHAARLLDAYLRPSRVWGEIAAKVAGEREGVA